MQHTRHISTARLIQRRNAWLKKLAELGPVSRGSLVTARRGNHIAHQLILHGSLIKSLCKTFGSARNFARRLAESMRNHSTPEELALPGQIRFQPP